MELEIGKGAFQGCGKGAQQLINVSLTNNTQLNMSAFAGAKIDGIYIAFLSF